MSGVLFVPKFTTIVGNFSSYMSLNPKIPLLDEFPDFEAFSKPKSEDRVRYDPGVLSAY